MLEVLADELERLNDPRLELVTFTGVNVSRDLSHAKVYYSTLAATTRATTDESREAITEGAAVALRAAGSHLRGVVGRQMRIRQVPRLDFVIDPGIVSGQRIDEILREVHHTESASDEAGHAGGEVS
jgi:ribosome-binding factor A